MPMIKAKPDTTSNIVNSILMTDDQFLPLGILYPIDKWTQKPAHNKTLHRYSGGGFAVNRLLSFGLSELRLTGQYFDMRRRGNTAQ